MKLDRLKSALARCFPRSFAAGQPGIIASVHIVGKSMSINRRALVVGAAAVPVAMALPAIGLFDPEAAEIERVVAEVRRAP